MRLPRPGVATWSALAAVGWSAAYGLLGVYWWSGGGGFPYGAGNDPAARISLLGGAEQATAAPVIAGFAAVGALVAAAMVGGTGRGAGRLLITGFGIGAAIILALVIPDYRVFVLVAYTPIVMLGAPLGLDPTDLLTVVDPPLMNQLACLAGGMVWAAASVGYWRRTSDDAPGGTRTWATPAAAARWGRRAAYVAISVPLVYAVTRYLWALGIPLGISQELFEAGQGTGLWYFGAALASWAVIGAMLTFGLVRRWGEVFPRWLPFIGGRSVPVPLAVVPASIMAVLITNAGLMYWRMTLSGGFPVGDIELTVEHNWAALTPELLWPAWGVALAAATVAYVIRRRA